MIKKPKSYEEDLYDYDIACHHDDNNVFRLFKR